MTDNFTASNEVTSWVAPAVSTLNYTNCTLAGQWLVTLIKGEDFGLWTTLLLIRDGLSSSIANGSIAPPTYSDLAVWFLHDSMKEDSEIGYSIGNYTIDYCTQNVCPSLGWQGNSDLAGRGMVFSYGVQAALTTIYICLLISIRLFNIKDARIPAAIKHSTRMFLDASLLFSIAMLVAATFTLARSLRFKNTPVSTYTSLTTSYLSLFSILPPLLLQICASKDLRRTRWRLYIWALIGSLILVVSGLYYKSPWLPGMYHREDFNPQDPEFQLTWEFLCLDEKEAKKFDYAVKGLAVILIFFCILHIVIRLIAHRSPNGIFRKLYENLWWWMMAALCFLGMWGCFAAFLFFRSRFGKNGGKMNKDHDWSFGQILALATWAPVVVEAIYMWVKGPKDALTGQMMKGYRAVTWNEDNGGDLREGSVVTLQGYSEVPKGTPPAAYPQYPQYGRGGL